MLLKYLIKFTYSWLKHYWEACPNTQIEPLVVEVNLDFKGQ